MKILDQRYLPRWIVFLIDTLIASASFFLVYLLLSFTPIKFLTVLSIFQQGLVLVITTVIFFFVFKTYSGIIRHSTFTDITKLVFSSFFSFLVLFLFNIVFEYATGNQIFLNTSLIIYMLLSFSLMLLFRITVKGSYQFLRDIASGKTKKDVVIIGVDDTTISLGLSLIHI